MLSRKFNRFLSLTISFRTDDWNELFVFQVHEYLRSKLCSLYENDCIFDKFECCWSGNDSAIMTGSYNNFFRVFDRSTKRDLTLEAARDIAKPKTLLKPRKVSKSTNWMFKIWKENRFECKWMVMMNGILGFRYVQEESARKTKSVWTVWTSIRRYCTLRGTRPRTLWLSRQRTICFCSRISSSTFTCRCVHAVDSQQYDIMYIAIATIWRYLVIVSTFILNVLFHSKTEVSLHSRRTCTRHAERGEAKKTRDFAITIFIRANQTLDTHTETNWSEALFIMTWSRNYTLKEEEKNNCQQNNKQLIHF